MIKRVLGKILRPLFRRVVGLFRISDPWERLEINVPLSAYGAGARRDFREYLGGQSIVPVTSVEDIQSWLLGCSYERDEVLFAETDFWQHPVTFERLRAGDCEDFSLWAWRKLVELKHDVDFVAGYTLESGRLAGRHAWLLLSPRVA